MKKGWIAAALAVAVVGAGAMGILLNAPEKVQTAPVRQGDVERTRSAIAERVKAETTEIRADRSGVLEELLIERGEQVSVGDSVAVFSGDTLEEQLTEARAKLATLDAQADQARRAAEAVQNAQKEYEERLSQAVSAAESVTELALSDSAEYAALNEAIEAANQTRASAVFADEVEEYDDSAQRTEVQNRIDELETQLNNRTVYSAQSGKVISLGAEAGQTVLEGEVLAVVGDETEDRLQILDGNLRLGQQLRATVNGRTWELTVSSVQGDAAYASLPTGFPTQGDIDLTVVAESAKDVCVLPVECVASDDTGDYVMILSDGRLTRRAVETSIDDGQNVAVTMGVGAGERAVYFPERYEDGQRAAED